MCVDRLHSALRAAMAASPRLAVLLPAVAVTLAYVPVYMFRYPLYVLRAEDLGAAAGADAELKTYVSMASVLGSAHAAALW
jgi:hypothetical protein